MFERITPEDIAKARDYYLDKKQFEPVFKKLPRVGEIFETIEAHTSARIACLHLRAAFILVNTTTFVKAMSGLTGTENLGFQLTLEMTRFMFLTNALDNGHMTALVHAIQTDGKDLMMSFTGDPK